jgi:threonylcarbamoyladenosine tRNA methylthiotransferase MtaB
VKSIKVKRKYMMENKNKKVAFKTIGCKVNQYETGAVRQAFLEDGYTVVDFREKADIYLINTCAVTREAERKSRQMIRKANRTNPLGTIIVTGCGVQANLEDLKDCCKVNCHIISNYYKGDIFNIFNRYLANPNTNTSQKLIHFKKAELINEYHENNFTSINDRIRGLVKIQDGCNQFCSYCVIPYLRGRARSRSSKEILLEIKKLIKSGYKEVVLLGINLGTYGEDLKSKDINLAKLIKMIEENTDIVRIRLSSIELPWVTDELIKVLNDSLKVCHHLHISLQSGDDNTLSLMRRKYDTNKFEEKVRMIERNLPDVAITTDIIVGFPGEDEMAFKRTYSFLKRIGFAKIHVFPYSERPMTLAALLPGKNEPEIIKTRVKEINKLSVQLRKEFFSKNINQEKEILVEDSFRKNDEEYFCGLTDNYIKVCIKGLQRGKGEIITARLKEVFDLYVEGEEIID